MYVCMYVCMCARISFLEKGFGINFTLFQAADQVDTDKKTSTENREDV